MPNPNKTKYATDERTVNTGTTNLPVQFGAIRTARSIIITNKDATAEITARLNDVANDARVIEAGKSLVLNDEYVTSAYISNASGSSVDFAVLMIGG